MLKSLVVLISACVCRRASQPNGSSAVVWLSFWCSTRFTRKKSHPTRRVVQTSFLHFWKRNFWTVPQAKSNLINASFCFNIWDPYAKESSPRGLGWGPSMNKKSRAINVFYMKSVKVGTFFNIVSGGQPRKKPNPLRLFAKNPYSAFQKRYMKRVMLKKQHIGIFAKTTFQFGDFDLIISEN